VELTPLEIFLAQIPLNLSLDFRPVVIARLLSNNDVEVVSISAALNLYRSEEHFLVEQDRVDFQYTGLKKTSFVVSATPVKLHRKFFKKYLGRFQGQLAVDFRNWYGL
jgi:hypothetical protein